MKSGRLGIVVTVALVIALGALARTTRVRAVGHALDTRKYEATYHLPPPPWLRAFSLGHREALADLIWLRALVYFGEEIRQRGEVSFAFNYAESMLALDPYFRAVYKWIGTVALYRTGTITARDGWRAISFLERGTRVFPNDGEMAWELGATLMYDLPPLLTTQAERDDARLRGLQALESAVRLGGGPEWLVLSNVDQMRKLGERERAIRHLEEMYASVRDPDTREQIRLRLEDLRSRAQAETFVEQNQRFDEARKRDFPYMSPDLYWHVGPRPPIDGVTLRERHFLPFDAFGSSEDIDGEE